MIQVLPGVGINIPQGIPIVRGIQHAAGKSTLEQVTAPIVLSIYVHRPCGQQALHQPRKRALRGRAEQQVNMVSHQAIAMNLNPFCFS